MEEIIKLAKAVFKWWQIIGASTVFMAVLMILLTKNIERLYESQAVIYTGITTGESIVQGRTDNTVVSSSYDNMVNIIISRKTLTEVGLRLLAMHLGMQQDDQHIIEKPKNFETVQGQIPPDIRKLKGANDSITYLNLAAAFENNHGFLVNAMTYHPYYSHAALSKLTSSRQRSSDMIKLIYTSNDPAVCQKTLEILIDVSIRNYRQMKEGQTDRNVLHFEEQLRLAQEKLKQSEEKGDRFKREHGVADLTIQTEFAIADRQQITSRIQTEQSRVSELEAGIRQVELSMGTQVQALKRTDIMHKRERLGKLSSRLINAQMSRVPDADEIANLQSQYDQLSEELNREINANLTPATSGRTNDLANTEYFNKVIAYEESKARLNALENQRSYVTGQFAKHQPLADTMRRIQREIDINLKEYLTALENRNQQRLQQQNLRSFSNIEVIDKPFLPRTAQSKRQTLIVLGTMIGFVIPSSIFLGMAYFNTHLQTPKRVEEKTGLRTAGIIPNTRRLEALKNSDMIRDGLSDTILKNLYLTDKKSDQMRILVISTRPGEGKTMISNLLCERLLNKGRRCLVVTPYMDSGSWSVASYKVDQSFYRARAEDIVPVEKMSDADILIIELPPLIMNDYPVELIRQFDMAFLICKANRDWVKADQTALDSFIKISGITPYIILNEVELDVVEEILGKIN